MNTEHEYFAWLCEKIEYVKHPEYTLLIGKLYRTSFEIPENITEDRIRMRKASELRSYLDMPVPNFPISVLEVLISVAIETERNIMRDSEAGDRTAVWFWQMIDNLGLLKYTDENYDHAEVCKILHKFLHRQYRKNGVGSVGFTTHRRSDFRKMDIWQQFNIYLTEQYF